MKKSANNSSKSAPPRPTNLSKYGQSRDAKFAPGITGPKPMVGKGLPTSHRHMGVKGK